MWLYLFLIPFILAVPTDDECYKTSVQSFEGVSVDEKGYFHQVVLKCLKNDANVESMEFLNCLIGYNKCNVNWLQLINWEHCACHSFLATAKTCLTQWIIDGHTGSLDCLKKLAQESSNCISKQTIR